MQIFQSRITLLILALLLIWVGYAAGREVYRAYNLQEKAAMLREDIQGLKQAKEKLDERITSLRNDDSIIEQEARERLNLKKPGEYVVVLLRPEKQQPPKAQLPQSTTTQDFLLFGWLKKLLQ